MEERKYWIDAVEQFSVNIEAVVSCPNCKEGLLCVEDIAFDDRDIQKGGERYIKCLQCGKCEVVLYRNPPKNWYFKTK